MPDPSPSSPEHGSTERVRAKESLRLRLTLWVLAIYSVLQWTSVGVFWLYKQTAIGTLFDRGMIGRATAIGEHLRPLIPGIDEQQLNKVANDELRHTMLHPYILDVFDSDNRPITQRPTHLDPEHVGVTEALSTNSTVLRHLELSMLMEADPEVTTAGVVALPLRGTDGRQYVLVFAADNGLIRAHQAQIGRVLLVTGLVGTAAAGLSGWLIAGLAVAPLGRLRELARTLRPESLTESIEIKGAGGEVENLARELEEARARIQARIAAQERFLTNVSHELKTPISVLLTEAETLNTQGLPTHVQNFIVSARDEMSRLGHLVESFLTLSRIQDGKGMAVFRVCAANDLVIDSAERNAMMADQHQVRLIPMILSGDQIDAALAGEPELLGTMLDNILRNAIRFSPEGGRIEIGVRVDGPSVVITVRDEGPGIPQDRLATIFDRFAQAHGQERAGRGHGLGLTIAQGIAELHGGVITAANLPDHGCEFTITLPLSGSEAGPTVNEGWGTTGNPPA